ncbi:hypothetical protein MUP77_08735, partial [Candidatus Bathyarchaeota archaeon]|nr:hypothetical protein [Candidatus Bathyarchaeota archaeon]
MIGAGSRRPLKEVKDIPYHLFSETSKSFRLAYRMVFENIDDIQTLAERSGMTPRSIAEVQRNVRKAAGGVHRMKQIEEFERRQQDSPADQQRSSSGTVAEQRRNGAVE